MQTIKLKRKGSDILEEVSQQQFYIALRRANNIDDLIRIGDVHYSLSSLDVSVPVVPPSGGSLFAAVPVSNNEMMHLFTTPKLIVPAPGVGKFIRVSDAFGKNLAGTIPFAGLAPKLRYVNVLGNDISQFDLNFLTSAQTVVRSGNLNIANAKNYPENTGVEFYVPGFDLTAGNGSMIIAVTYTIQDY